MNVVGYRAVALDFELWSRTRKEIQRVHLEHFITLMHTSRFKRFNISQRISKMNIVRKLLFVLQTDWYQVDMVPFVVETLAMTAKAHFSKDEAIKPIVAFLAANLQAGKLLSKYSRTVHIITDPRLCSGKLAKFYDIARRL